MEIREIDGNTFKQILKGGALEMQYNIEAVNELNVFPVPDGDTGTNMSRTIESGISKISDMKDEPLGAVASEFAKGSLFGARGNSGVILSQFFAGLCGALADKVTATTQDFANAYIEGVKRSYSAVVNPVEGTILTVFRESAEYARSHITEDSTLEDFLMLNIEEAERSLGRTKEILPVLTEADVVDSGGAGYLCIAKGMYESINGTLPKDLAKKLESDPQSGPDFDLFTTDSVLEYGYCTECLVRLQRAKLENNAFDEAEFIKTLESFGCDSIVAIKDGDVLKLHAHTKTPSDILTLAQKYGEFLNVKIENMSLQHSEKLEKEAPKKKKLHKPYGVVTVAGGDGMKALFESLGADVVISGGQTCNPSTEDFLKAFEELDADNILVLPNNKNVLLTANQAAELFPGGNVHVVPTKTVPEGYSALSVFNASVTDVNDQISDLISAKDAVASGEITVAVRDSVISGLNIKEGEYIAILGDELVSSDSDPVKAALKMLNSIEDMDDREIITVFVGESVSEEERLRMTEALEEHFEDQTVEFYIGGQKIYDYLIAVE